ncbi:MAG: CHAT domain-containing protein [candidate division Zixibacteria bacterium]|nr:CHAT domain-containing protein [candidate division Zixibacteria bacterium]
MISLAEIKRLDNRSAVERIIAGRYGGDVEILLKEFDGGLNYLLRSDLKKAELYLKAAAVCYSYLPAKNKPRYFSMEARLRLWTGDYKTALKKYVLARRLFASNRDFANVARVGRGLMDVYMYLGKYPEALETGRKSLNYFRRRGSTVDVGQMLNNIGNVYHRMDRNRMALRYYDGARRLFEKEGGLALAIVEYNRANIFANLNQIKKATALYLVVSEIYHKADMAIAAAQTRYSLAYLYFLQDRYTEALKTFEEVYNAFTKRGDLKSATMTQLDLVEINLQLNQYGSVVMMGEALIGRFEKLGMRYEQAKAAFFVAQAKIMLGDFKPALVSLGTAERLFKREQNKLWLGMVSDARSRIYIATGQYAPARQNSLAAGRLFKAGGDERRSRDTEIRQLEILAKAGRQNQILKKNEALKKKKLFGYQHYHLNYLMGDYYFSLEDYATALKYFRAAVENVEKMIAGLYHDEIRFFFLLDKFDCYLMTVECLLKLNRVKESFLYHLKGLATVNQRSSVPPKLKAEVPAKLLATRERLRAALKKMTGIPRTGQRTASEKPSYFATEQKLWSNEKRIRSILYPDGEPVLTVLSGAAHLEDWLEADETVVNFIKTAGQTGAFCAASGRTDYVPFETTPVELEILLRKLHFVFEKAVFGLRDVERNRDVIDFCLREIHNMIFKPLQPFIKGKKLIIISDGFFSQIPFTALRDENGACLKDRYEIRTIVNPDDLRLREKQPVSLGQCRNAVFAVTSGYLPSITVEGQQIKNSFEDARLYIDSDADCRNLREELSLCDGFVHIATHASRSSENPLFSRILMSDGPFFPFDLFGSGLKARLVTLSGCQTAAPGLYYGNSFSLAKAFYQAGSRYVLASLWPVSDKLSMQFMIYFYQYLKHDGDISRSYNRAIDKLTEVTNNPAFWSSFILLGM